MRLYRLPKKTFAARTAAKKGAFSRKYARILHGFCPFLRPQRSTRCVGYSHFVQFFSWNCSSLPERSAFVSPPRTRYKFPPAGSKSTCPSSGSSSSPAAAASTRGEESRCGRSSRASCPALRRESAGGKERVRIHTPSYAKRAGKVPASFKCALLFFPRCFYNGRGFFITGGRGEYNREYGPSPHIRPCDRLFRRGALPRLFVPHPALAHARRGGLGRYQMALTVFSVLLMLSASGLPATLSRTVAAHRTRGDKRAERSAVTAALLLSFGVSLLFEVLLFALRPFFSGVFSDEGAERLFYILLLGLPPTAVYAVLRGYFWGEKRFFLYSFTELSEEAVMIAADPAFSSSARSPLRRRRSPRAPCCYRALSPSRSPSAASSRAEGRSPRPNGR